MVTLYLTKMLNLLLMQGQVLVAQLDLANFDSIINLAQMLNQEERIDVLVCNAAVMATPLSYTRHGFETQIGTNHFGHFLLFKLLEAKLASEVSKFALYMTKHFLLLSSKTGC